MSSSSATSQASNTSSAASQTGNSTSSTSSTISIPQTAAAGGLTITEPPQTATSFYKVAPSQMITFGWNMTSVIATPTHLTVSAKCDNGNTYPVGPTDGIIPGTATAVVWDVYSYQENHPTNPLVPGSCTLLICDERGYGASRKAGFMSPNSALTFALYTPQAYTPLSSGWECSICNSSLSSYVAQPTVITLLATFFVVFFSGFHLLRNAAKAL